MGKARETSCSFQFSIFHKPRGAPSVKLSSEAANDYVSLRGEIFSDKYDKWVTWLFCCVWQCFVDDNQSGFGAKTSSTSELRDTVMALRLREASLVSDMSALKRRLIELETQVCTLRPPLYIFYPKFGSLLSQIRLSSLMFVHRTHARGWNFWQYFFAILYLSHRLASVQNFTEIVPREPHPSGAFKRKRGSKMSRSGVSSPDELLVTIELGNLQFDSTKISSHTE